MKPRHIVFGSLIVLFGLLVLVVSLVKAQPIPPQELARRCTAARPGWASYQEDIKGLIGAKPAAEWMGEPVAARQDGARLELSFRLTGVWVDQDASLPILARFPDGQLLCSADGERREGVHVYRFSLSEGAAATHLPWFEVRYPHGERRIVLDAAGRWDKSE